MLKRWLLWALLWVSVGAHAATEFQYYVYPVESITGISRSAKPSSTGSQYAAMINEKYANLFFDSVVQKTLIASFTEEVKNKFPTSVVAPNQIRSSRSGKYAYQPFNEAQCNPSFTAYYKDTFAIAMGISRLSVYVNTYGSITQVLVPVTYTIRFVKLNGASVIFSKSETIYTDVTAATSEILVPGSSTIQSQYLQKIKAAILNDGLKMVARQTEAAASSFSPKQTKIAIEGRDGKYFIFSKGSEVGFSSGEDFDATDDAGNEYVFTVEYATNGLAIAVASEFSSEVKNATNRLRAGEALQFVFTKQGKDDNKPSVLAVQYSPTKNKGLSEQQLINNALLSVITDDLGFKAPFNLIKHDADFFLLKNQIRAEANCEATMYAEMNGFADNSTMPRANPDYYLKLDALRSPVLTLTGLQGVTTQSVFDNTVVISLINRSGVVDQTFLGNNSYELNRTGGKGLAIDQASEINLKNAALAATETLVAQFSTQPQLLPISSVNKGSITLSKVLPLSVFDQAKVVRPLRIGFAGKTVYLPLASSVVQLVKPLQDSNQIEIKGELKSSDFILLAAFNPENKKLKACDASRNRQFLTPPLNTPSYAEEMVLKLMAAHFKGYHFYETETAYIDSVQIALRDGFFASQKVERNFDTPYCAVVVELQQLPKNECTAADICSGTVAIASGLRVYEGTTKIAESINGAKVDFTDIQSSVLPQFAGLKAYEQQINSIPVHQKKFK